MNLVIVYFKWIQFFTEMVCFISKPGSLEMTIKKKDNFNIQGFKVSLFVT